MYDLVIIGAGPAGIYAAYEAIKINKKAKILIIEKGNTLEKRVCPQVVNPKINCINCPSCAIMNGFGGAGAFSDGKYNITNEFGGNLYSYIGYQQATELMEYVDEINMNYLKSKKIKLFDSNHNHKLSTLAMQHDLKLLAAKVRHLGTDNNYLLLEAMYKDLNKHTKMLFNSKVIAITKEKYFQVKYLSKNKEHEVTAKNIILATGRSGSELVVDVCEHFNIELTSTKVDLGVRVEIPAQVFEHITKEVYEGKFVYKTKRYSDLVRTFCMNPNGVVVTENVDGVITVNGHSYSDDHKKTKNTNFALLVAHNFTEPFNNSFEYGKAIARLSNMLGGGVIVQQFGDLIKGQRSTASRMAKGFVKPTLNATPGDLSLVLPKRCLDNIIEMIYALNNIAPGVANDSTLLYGVEVKFYNSCIKLDQDMQTHVKGLYILGDCSGITHSLSHASASGIYVARKIFN